MANTSVGVFNLVALKQRVGLLLNGSPLLASKALFRQLLKGTKETGQESLGQTVEFAQDISDDPNSAAGFTQLVTGTQRTPYKAASQSVGFTQEVTATHKTTQASLISSMDLSQAIGGTNALGASGDLNVSQTLDMSDSLDVERPSQGGVTFGQTVSYILLSNRGGMSAVKFRQGLFGYILRRGQRIAIDSVLADLTFTKSKSITFSFEELSVTVTAPELGNSDSLDYIPLVRKNEQNIPSVHADLSRPEVYTLNFEINTCNLLELVAFEAATRGEVVTLTDYMGRVWNGILNFSPKSFIRGAESISVLFVCRRIS